MGSVAVENNDVNNEKEERKRLDSITKLHDLVHKLEEDEHIPPSPTKLKDDTFEEPVNGDSQVLEKDDFSLENVKPLNEFDIDIDLESEDSWLYESPQKLQTPRRSRSADHWLRSNVDTPELLRVRGSLSAKLEVIAIESRKGQYRQISHRKESHEMRKNSKGGMLGSGSLSLDWDYDEGDNDLISIDRFDDESYEASTASYEPTTASYESDPDLDDLDGDLPPQRDWTSRQPKSSTDPENPFSLDWSDGEEDLKPMKIDFSQSTGTYRKSKPTVARRSGPGIAVVPPRQENQSPDDLVVVPRGRIKPRGAPTSRGENIAVVVPRQESESPDDLIAVPRGGIKPRGTPTSRGESPQPRRSGNIGKPVQRHKPEAADNNEAVTPRLRGSASATQLVKPRGATDIQKSSSATDISQSDNLKVRLPNNPDGGTAIRRRGATAVGDGGLPTPRRSKEPSPVARVQGIPQVRRSTGSIPQKSEGLPRPRQSVSPNTGIVRPRGQGVTQSYQSNY